MADTGVNGTAVLMKIGTKLLAGQMSTSFDESVSIIATTNKLSANRAATSIGDEYSAKFSIECMENPDDAVNATYAEVRTTFLAREAVAFTFGGLEAGDAYITGYLIIESLSKAAPKSDKVTYTISAVVTGYPITGVVGATSTAAEFLLFAAKTVEQSADIVTGAGTIAVHVKAGIPVTALVAFFELSPGAIARVGTTVQVSGITANNYTSPVVFVVTAQDGVTTKAWTVTVTADL